MIVPSNKAKPGEPQEDYTLKTQAMSAPIQNGANKLIIGLLKEKEKDEKRVALTPQDVELIVKSGFEVLVEEGAGEGAKFLDLQYSEAGAKIIENVEKILKDSHIIVKISPLTDDEILKISTDAIVISALNLSTQSRQKILKMQKKKLTALAYEFFEDQSGFNPFLHSIGEIIGTSAVMIASEMLTTTAGGRGIMLGGITGLPPTNIIVLGTDIAAEYAVRIAMGLGANVKVFDRTMHNLIRFRNIFGQNLYTSTFNYGNLRKELESTDVVINSLVRQQNNHFIINEDFIQAMKEGAIIIDLKVDQGSIVETARITNFEKPTYTIYGVTHYCVPNMASRVAHSSSTAISNLLTDFLIEILQQHSIIPFLQYETSIRQATYMFKGVITNNFVAEKFDFKYTDINFIVHIF